MLMLMLTRLYPGKHQEYFGGDSTVTLAAEDTEESESEDEEQEEGGERLLLCVDGGCVASQHWLCMRLCVLCPLISSGGQSTLFGMYLWAFQRGLVSHEERQHKVSIPHV